MARRPTATPASDVPTSSTAGTSPSLGNGEAPLLYKPRRGSALAIGVALVDGELPRPRVRPEESGTGPLGGGRVRF